MKRLKVFDPEQLDVTFTFEVDEREGTVKRILKEALPPPCEYILPYTPQGWANRYESLKGFRSDPS